MTRDNTVPPDVALIQSMVEALYREKAASRSWGESSIVMKWKDGALELLTVNDQTIVKPKRQGGG